MTLEVSTIQLVQLKLSLRMAPWTLFSANLWTPFWHSGPQFLETSSPHFFQQIFLVVRGRLEISARKKWGLEVSRNWGPECQNGVQRFAEKRVQGATLYYLYISQLIRFARVCSHVDDFNTRNKCLTAKLLKQGYRYHKLRKALSKFYRRHYGSISKFNVGLKSLLHQGLSEPEFYGD